jgi:hypothetical protein
MLTELFNMEDKEEIFGGVGYYHASIPAVYKSSCQHAYYFTTYIGMNNKIKVEEGDCVYYFSNDLKKAILERGPCEINSLHCATIIRGYMPSELIASLEGASLLPYINGCSIRQLMPPPRPGDPTLQFLQMPAFATEQAHHTHSTARVVYVLDGKGKSIVGVGDKITSYDLVPGTVCILNPMCPHHFEVPYEYNLKVIPLHIFSSTGNLEKMHPMFYGTNL